MESNPKYELCIIGGAGHVGLPLGVVFANSGVKTVLLDINEKTLEHIQSGKFPFKEIGGDEALKSALEKGTLWTSHSPEVISDSKFVLIVIGTPIDEHLNPHFGGIMKLLDAQVGYFRDGQIVILRSTVYPGTTEKIQNYFIGKNKKVKVAFCPERIAQSYAIQELKVLPQIVSTFDDEALKEVSALFSKITPAEIIPVKPIEAELAKLFTNSWRYIKFAVANQFFMIAHDHGLNYYSIEQAMKKDYARNSDLPSPGFAAGPCLFKDTMQLAAFTDNNFWLGHAAMLVNEGLVNHLVKGLRREHGDSLKEKTIGILGMAFKPEVDDPRDSLSYKLRKIAQVECKAVLCTDEYIQDPGFVSLDVALANSDILILATPHKKYLEINPKNHPGKKFVDVWNLLKKA
ncbi:nucleotide sugar dehydrogenase [bacterium]|nr:MAG: nucleotide sugar dehydrogenase [bacterium]